MGIDDNKAPGCDGYNSFFFKKTWHILGEKVTAVVIKFFENADMCKAINCTTIILIPKVKNPTNIKDFRPISCCTVLYKIISKVLTTRLHDVMVELIDNCQTVFVPGRLITNNIIMSHELVKGYERKNISPRSASSLIANRNKSCIYFGGVSNLLQQQIMDMLGYTKGELPFRYLGVPLSTKRLSAMQCELLIQRMLSKIQSWTTKFLSYAGRTVLVKSVLFAIQILWAQIFILPNKIIQFIETICRRFLWTGAAEPTNKALIAWDKLCASKVAGGLNFTNVEMWNKEATCNLLWNICTRKEKLWVTLIHTYYIKENTVWTTDPKSASWVIQKIFKAKSYFEDAGFTEEDVQKMEKCSVKQIYKAMHGEFPKMTWRKLVCNNQRLPKWIFILRLIIQQRLATKERLARWGIISEQTCSLCQRENETVPHLFFDCEISGDIWQHLLKWQGIQRTKKAWQEELTWLEQFGKGKSGGAAIIKKTDISDLYFNLIEKMWPLALRVCFIKAEKRHEDKAFSVEKPDAALSFLL
ncbi:uncharacterized protein LOC142175873 [Nicotiana tabacum]|uniref:Uncharacterized protein LOC142175873 n=1 Tax=Nicotiana tabacum TaxID=4097 RepID=A0AC58TP31_TOBAC